MPPFDAGTLSEILARPADPPARIDGLLPWDAAMLLTAQRKTGKTTLVANMSRSLLTGEPFLGRFGVRPLDGDIAFLNYEVSGQQLARWAADVGVPGDRFYMVNLRGRRNPLSDPEDRATLAATLRARGVEMIICDPFGRAFTGASQNDAGEVQQFLIGLDQFARGEVGARDVILTAHAGWNGERTRGSTALEDWADSIITLTRDDSDTGDGARFLRAIGRDVDVEEDRLSYDPAARTLTLAGTGSRKASADHRRADELHAAVLRIVTLRPGMSGGKIEAALRDEGVSFQRGQERKALAALVESGDLVCVAGSRGAKCYSAGSPSPTLPDPPRGGAGDPPHPLPIGGGGPKGGSDARPSPVCRSCNTALTREQQTRGTCGPCFLKAEPRSA
jgi:hypothetical protein